MAETVSGHPSLPPPPLGFHQARVDDRGRLKLPAPFQRYLNGFAEKQLFVTSLDGKSIRIYPIAVWRENMALLEQLRENSDEADDIAFLAYDSGSDAEMDAQGRVLIPAELRRELKLENSPVRLRVYKGRIDVFTEEDYQERRRKAMEGRLEKLAILERQGLR